MNSTPQGHAKVDATLEHPRSVFQLMKTHYSRYTPEMVASICGCSAEDFGKAPRISFSRLRRKAARAPMLYALGWTQHSHSVQLIHTAAMLQLMLGNIGMPGGGVNAQRGHSNIQGATDMGAWNMLPGYLRLPRANSAELSKTYLEADHAQTAAAEFHELLGKHAKVRRESAEGVLWRESHEGKRLRLRLSSQARRNRQPQLGIHLRQMYAGQMEGLIAFGMNPVANGPNTPKMLAAFRS